MIILQNIIDLIKKALILARCGELEQNVLNFACNIGLLHEQAIQVKARTLPPRVEIIEEMALLKSVWPSVQSLLPKQTATILLTQYEEEINIFNVNELLETCEASLREIMDSPN